MDPRRFLFLRGATTMCCMTMLIRSCVATPKKVSCDVQDGKADCSRLSLSAVPLNLPRNITSLDMSHNRLTKLPPESLTQYQDLVRLDVSYNSITKIDVGVCRTLPLLEALVMEHNQVHLLQKEDLSDCTGLTWLNLGGNRLKLRGEPFSVLQNLKFLDVSKNDLNSAKLGSQPQLPSLESLSLGHNAFSRLMKDDFLFLSGSPGLQVLNLSSISLKSLEPGCLQPIQGLRTLIMDGGSSQALAKLCSELSGTAINVLSLRQMRLVTLSNATFQGLRQTNLTSLDLSGNGLVRIETGSFHWLPALQNLILAENNIKHLTKETFQGLKGLKRLNLREALVKSQSSATPIVDDFSFQPLSQLESLDLDKTSVREITEQTFTGLKSLQDLNLGWTSYSSLKVITNKTFASLAASPLRKLNLTGAAIVKINDGAFLALKNLTVLLLDHNYIKQTLTGKEFEGLAQLQEMHVYSNHQTVTLNVTSFVEVPNLRVLTLGKSLTSLSLDLDPSPFKPLSNITYLDLSNNNIANMRKSLVEGLVNLKVLKLQHNNLARLWKNANQGGPVLYLQGLQSLTTLEMDNTGLDEIPLKAFSGLSNLRELSLGSNLLDRLRDSVFDDLTSLRVLRLQKNLITAVRPQVFRVPMSNLSVLDMEKNPFDCTCESILWFMTWLNQTNTTTVPNLLDQYICNTPLGYYNRSILKFDALSCKDMTPFQTLYILSSTLVIMIMVTALLMRFHGWRIQFYWNIMINRSLGFSDATAEEGRQYEYDAYIINAEDDAQWVERRMIPLENDNCKFCLEDRDGIPGMSLLQSIVDNMRNSRKILFVVTESLLNDPWCRRFKAHHALHQVIEDSRDSVVLVFLQDVHDYKLSRSLYLRRGMLRSHCVLHWPIHKARVAAFHQKLLIALGMTNRLKD